MGFLVGAPRLRPGEQRFQRRGKRFLNSLAQVGNRHLRRALYMPALTAAHHDAAFRAYYVHLQAMGRCKVVALVAVMRKLLRAVFGMFKHDALFDASRVYRIPDGLEVRSAALA